MALAKSFYLNPDYAGKTMTRKIAKDMLIRSRGLDDELKQRTARTLKSLYKKKPPDNPQYSLDSVMDHKKYSKFVDMIQDAAGDIENSGVSVDEAIDKLYEKAQDIKAKSLVQRYEVIDWLDDFENRQERRLFEKTHPELRKALHFGIPMIDMTVPRGIGIGEMFSVAAKTGIGKSIMLDHVGLFAIYQGLNVTQIITENSIDQTATRYDSRATGVPYDDFKTYNFDGEKSRLIHQAESSFEMLRDAVDARLKIAKCEVNNTSSADILEIINGLEKVGHKTDVLLVDSPELMKSVGKYESTRLEKAAVYYELLALVDKYKMIGGVSTQLTRDASDTTSGPEALSEAYEKARLLAYIFFLSQTQKQKMLGELTWRMVKARDAENNGDSIILHPDLAVMCIDTGI